MDPRSILKERFENSSIEAGSVKIPVLDSVPLEHVSDSNLRIRQCIHYINNHTGISYLGMGKKAKVVYKFMRFIVDTIVAQQNSIDSNLTTALNELYKLNKQKHALHDRINKLEARIVALETKS